MEDGRGAAVARDVEKAKARAAMEAAVAQASTATAAARAEQRLTGVLTMAMREVRDGRYS